MQRKEQNKFTWDSLYNVIQNHIGKSEYTTKNNKKAWKYGYDEKNDMVVISKDGTIGEIYEINGVKIALPKKPSDCKKG